MRALHPDLDPTKKQLENRFIAYRPVDGVLRSFGGSQHDAADGRWLQTSVVTALRQNVVLDDALFAMGAMPDRRGRLARRFHPELHHCLGAWQ